MAAKSKGPTKVFGITIGKAKPEKAEPELSAEQRAAHTYIPTIPSLNVIPEETVRKYQIRGLVRRFIFAGIGVVALLGLAYGGGVALTNSISARVTDAEAEQQQITAEINALQPFQAFYDDSAAYRNAVGEATREDVNMGDLYADLIRFAGEENLLLTGVTTTQYAAGVTSQEGCVSPDPFGLSTGETTIGCITITGEASTKDDVNEFLSKLVNLDGVNTSYRDEFVSTFATTVDQDGTVVSTFTASVNFTATQYSGKYSYLTIPLDEATSDSEDNQEDSDN